ncbi:hypothetical protein HYW74_02245 [Candidatus Pacearchaeota archaeon]|nr:hypothetical protein [Candidatus Pacearchaeota archaeon]
MTKDNLEGKTQAPIVIFRDGIEFGGSGMGGVRLVKKEGNVAEGFSSFGYNSIEGVYDAEGRPQWENYDFNLYRRAQVPDNLKGTQVVFTEQVIYEGPSMGRHHFSFLKDGRYIGHDHNQHAALDFGYQAVKAIFDRNGKSVWENFDYIPSGETQ